MPTPNLVQQPRFFKKKAILLKLETNYGVDATPAGATDWVEARNVSLTPMDNDKVARNIDMPYQGNGGQIVVGSWCKLQFDIALVGSGTPGQAPKFAPALLATGWAETVTVGTSATYNLISEAFPSLTGYINIDGTLHKMLGMRGDVKAKQNRKDTPMLTLSYDSVYIAPVVGPMPVVNRSGWSIEEGVNSVNSTSITINAIPLSYSAFEWSRGNKISRIDLPGPQREIAIPERAPTASCTVLAPGLAQFDPFALTASGIVVPLSATHGSVAGKKIKTDLKVRIIDVAYEDVEGMTGYKLSLEPTPVDGNDEIALTFI